MSLGNPPLHRLRVALSGLAATSLALAGIALASTPTAVAAPASPASDFLPTSPTGAPVNPAPYTLTQPDGSTVRVHASATTS